MKKLAAPVVALVVVLLAPAAARADDYWYFGHHPINPAAIPAGGFCSVSGSHHHQYDIDQHLAHLYRVNNNHYYFAGDPYEFGYQQAAYGYYGHHPIGNDYGGGHCYLDGAHHHNFVPMPLYYPSFVTHGGYYYYNGVFDQSYYVGRPMYWRTSLVYRTLPAYRRTYVNAASHRTRYAVPSQRNFIRKSPVHVRAIYSNQGRAGFARLKPGMRAPTGRGIATSGAYRKGGIRPLGGPRRGSYSRGGRWHAGGQARRFSRGPVYRAPTYQRKSYPSYRRGGSNFQGYRFRGGGGGGSRGFRGGGRRR